MAQYICFVGVQLQGFFNQGISLHQLGGGKAQRQPGGSGMVLNQMSDRMDAAMHRAPGVCWVTACRAEVDAARQLPVARHMDGVFDQLINALVFGGRNGNNRNAQRFFQLVYHDGAAVGAHFVHHVQRQHHGGIQLHQLHGQVQVALNVGSIHNVDNAGRRQPWAPARSHLRITPSLRSTVTPGKLPTCWLEPVSWLNSVVLPQF